MRTGISVQTGTCRGATTSRTALLHAVACQFAHNPPCRGELLCSLLKSHGESARWGVSYHASTGKDKTQHPGAHSGKIFCAAQGTGKAWRTWRKGAVACGLLVALLSPQIRSELAACPARNFRPASQLHYRSSQQTACCSWLSSGVAPAKKPCIFRIGHPSSHGRSTPPRPASQEGCLNEKHARSF